MYFDDDQNFARLLAELQRWKGTRFGRGTPAPGVCCTCSNFCDRVLVNIGAITPAQFPARYATRGGGKELRQIMQDVIEAIPEFAKVWQIGQPAVEPMRGDMLMISTGEAVHHLAIVASPPTVWHCLDKVTEANLQDPSLRSRFWAIYRVR